MSWSGSGPGSYTGANDSASVTMNGPITQTANYEAIPISEFPGIPFFEVLALVVLGTVAVFLAPTKPRRKRQKRGG